MSKFRDTTILPSSSLTYFASYLSITRLKTGDVAFINIIGPRFFQNYDTGRVYEYKCPCSKDKTKIKLAAYSEGEIVRDSQGFISFLGCYHVKYAFYES